MQRNSRQTCCFEYFLLRIQKRERKIFLFIFALTTQRGLETWKMRGFLCWRNAREIFVKLNHWAHVLAHKASHQLKNLALRCGNGKKNSNFPALKWKIFLLQEFIANFSNDANSFAVGRRRREGKEKCEELSSWLIQFLCCKKMSESSQLKIPCKNPNDFQSRFVQCTPLWCQPQGSKYV